MGKNSLIEWTDHTYNPWWGCQKVSPGCKNCYAERIALLRYGDLWGQPEKTSRHIINSNEAFSWNNQAEKSGMRRRVFCGSMCDIFEDHPGVVTERETLWNTIEHTPWLEWLLLTKRPENINKMLPSRWYWHTPVTHEPVMPDNIWFGFSAENQHYFDMRMPVAVEAALNWQVRGVFASLEPLLGSITLPVAGLDWVITGGESGPNARRMDPEWAMDIRDQCIEYGIPYFHKQNGGPGKDKGGNLLYGEVYQEYPEKMSEPIADMVQLELF